MSMIRFPRTVLVLSLVAALCWGLGEPVASPQEARADDGEVLALPPDQALGNSLRARGLTGPGRQPAWTKSLPGGIDISHWNGSIDWDRVKATGKVQFVIAKATQGTSFQDPRYLANKAAVEGLTGVRFTAYDFADPEGGPKQAVDDANYFMDFANLDEGNIVPVLDVEQSNGYSKLRLREWVAAWLHRVYVRLGVRAIIYTSPSFFRTSLGDTTWFAKHGYPLWIAHWGVISPDVPAKSWGRRGWSVWQWTSEGTVAGIDGDVDRDVFAKHRLKRLLIP